MCGAVWLRVLVVAGQTSRFPLHPSFEDAFS